MGDSLCKMADFQNDLIFRIFCVLWSGFLHRTEHFAWVIAFSSWLIFKMILPLEYFVFSGAVFCTAQL